MYCNKHGLDNLNFFMLYEKYLYDKLKKLPVNSESFGIIHGDLNPSNMHLDDNGNITIFHFDHCAYGWRIHDLVVIKLCYAKNTYEEILEGYISKVKLSKVEKQLIELYGQVLIIRKYKDVLSMLKVRDHDMSKGFNEKKFIESDISTLYSLINH